MKKFSLKKLVTAVAVTTSLVAAATISASACTTIYVGAEQTQEKTPFVARTEDYGWNYNKQWFVMPQGKWAKGDTFLGCPGYGEFEWKFTHDSYRFTYFTNDQYQGTCPECGQENATHPSYTEFGTNEKGVSVSATETIYGRSEVTKTIDPFVKTKVDGKVGIEETDIPTIILAEADSAKAGVDLLLNIYKDYGAYFASGVFICDKNETWYIENCSGHEYVAIKVPDSMIFLEPNMAVIGRVDLDDKENIIASDKLIEVARQAGTFEGDADKNIIDFRASYAGRQDRMDQRMVDGLNYLNKGYNYTAEQLLADNTRFTISNVDKSDSIVTLYTNIKADRTLDKNDVFGYYKLSSIGKPSNQDIEIFQLFKDNDVTTGTVGWVGVGNMSNNVFVPYYPMLLTDSKDMYEGYQATLPAVQKVAERPADPNAFFVNDSKVGRLAVYPEGWRDSYYFSFEGLGGYIADAEKLTGTAISATDKKLVQDKMTALQNEFNETFAKVELKNATETSRQMAAKAHATALAMIDYLTGENNLTGLAVLDKNGNAVTKPQVNQVLIPVIQIGSADVYSESQSGLTLVPSSTAVNADIYAEPANPYANYVWHYDGSTTALSTASTYTVSSADQGKVLCLDVTVDGYKGSASWKAEAAVPYLPDSGRDDSSSGGSGSGSGSSTKPSTPTTPTNPKPDTSSAFNDVAAGSWYADAVKNVVNKGLMAGTGKDTFAPDNQVTRAMMWTVLARLDGKDVSGASTWYAKAMTWAIEKGVSDGTFPASSITREQLATMLWRAAGSPEAKGALTNFNDAASVSSWATQAMTWAVEQGLISGMGDGALNPQGNATRAQLAVILTAYAK